MNYKISGVFSITLAFAAIGIAVYRLFGVSIFIGTAYLISVPLVFLNVLYVYCRRCPHVGDRSCRHVLFGPIVARLFRQTKPKPYTVNEVLIALAPLVIVVVFPQYWLMQMPALLVAFWIMLLSAGAVVVKGVCPGCRNVSCAMCPRKK